jgi:5'-phosphate synthase pdxT subunit
VVGQKTLRVATDRQPDGPAPRVGVLALQGDVREHIRALRELGLAAGPVRTLAELDSVDALVLPGGESTTMDKMLRQFGLQTRLKERLAAGLPALATCAGTILLATEVVDGLPDQESLHALPVTVRRNAYGRQPDSFEADLVVRGLDAPFHGIFIRAPVIETLGDGVEVLAVDRGLAVAVAKDNIVALTFHPELTGDSRIHRLFVERAGLVAADEVA